MPNLCEDISNADVCVHAFVLARGGGVAVAAVGVTVCASDACATTDWASFINCWLAHKIFSAHWYVSCRQNAVR